MKIAYYTAGGREMASSRLRAWKIGDAFSAMGHEVTFNEEPGTIRPDVAVFQKRFDLNGLMTAYRNWGTFVVWDCDDHMANGPTAYADLVTVDTPAKLALYPGALVVPDALDLPDGTPVKVDYETRLTSVVWFGNPENFYHAATVATACRQLGIQFNVITRVDGLSDIERARADHLYEWSIYDVEERIIESDLVVLPCLPDGRWSGEWVRSKSANRLLKAWGLGMPVIATPIPSYIEVGLLHQATTPQEWIEQLTLMKHVHARVEDAERGVRIAIQYHAHLIAQQWLEVFEQCMQPH